MIQSDKSVVSLPSPVNSAGDPTYLERVYAGVLGKLIGVYLGRPVENWLYPEIERQFGEITYYIHEQRGRRLIITDDDISGMMTFLRALEDHDCDPDISPKQIGQTWLNYLIEDTTILWWGGLGNSTEHTAYLRLKSGVSAPESGSAKLNSQVVSEQIGGQIFIDGWGLICPGHPERAADFAERAARVSHDGEGVYGARALAALISAAFIEPNIDRLLQIATEQIPTNCTIYRLINDLRQQHATGCTWREGRDFLHANYGYDKFPGQCHIVPNHGLIILGLLWGEGDFDESMKIVNTCGWDTDCNSGNLGTIMGVRNGLAAFTKQDWRGPVADRLYLPSADGGRSISDAANEALSIANMGRRLLNLSELKCKDGARFHFCMPGSVQGWTAKGEGLGDVRQIFVGDRGGLLISRSDDSATNVCVDTPTFIPPDTKDMVTGYVLVANPTIYEGNILHARLIGTGKSVKGRFYLDHYNAEDASDRLYGPEFELNDGDAMECTWEIPNTGGYPIHAIGLEIEQGEVVLDWMDWKGVPNTSFPPVDGTMWGRAWAKAIHRFQYLRDRYEYLTQNSGIGMLSQGQRNWKNYRIEARLTPRMAVSSGIAVRVQGLQRYYAFVFGDVGEIRLDKFFYGRKSIARVSYPWKPFQAYEVAVEVEEDRLRLYMNGELILQATDHDRPIREGAFAFVVESGCMGAGTPRICPVTKSTHESNT